MAGVWRGRGRGTSYQRQALNGKRKSSECVWVAEARSPPEIVRRCKHADTLASETRPASQHAARTLRRMRREVTRDGDARGQAARTRRGLAWRAGGGGGGKGRHAARRRRLRAVCALADEGELDAAALVISQGKKPRLPLARAARAARG